MKQFPLFFIIIFFSNTTYGQDFITKWSTGTTGTTTVNISFGIVTTGAVNYSWAASPSGNTGSGSFTGTTASLTNLPINNTIELSISTTNFSRININNGASAFRLMEIKQWGGVAWTSLENSFYGCQSMNVSATDVPNLSNVVNCKNMFRDCYSLDTIRNVDTWNMTTVLNTEGMFRETKFNSDIRSWNMSNDTTMAYMFAGNDYFNQHIDFWNTSNVKDMSWMFANCYAFNMPIGTWNTGNVKNMSNMFLQTLNFNQSLENWNLSSLTTAANMFNNCYLLCGKYVSTLKGWANNVNTPNGITLGAVGRQYGLNGVAARASLVSNKSWIIVGDAAISDSCFDNEFVTIWDMNNLGGTTLSTGISSTGAFKYSWETIPQSLQFGIGSSNSTFGDIDNLPDTGKIILKIEVNNLNAITLPGINYSRDALIDITQWGSAKWQSFANAFTLAINLKVNATDVPNLSFVNSTRNMFKNCEALQTINNVNAWQTNNITDMGGMFENAYLFNSDISNWNTSNVKTMDSMFYRAQQYNQPMANWDMSNATNLNAMFMYAYNFNQPLNSWNVSSVQNMEMLFAYDTVFNQPLNNWNVGNVTNMSGLFFVAKVFNQPLNNWNTTNVSNFSGTFGLSSFNQPLNNWNTSSAITMEAMFANSPFNQNINNWNTGNVTDMGSMFAHTPFNQPLDTWNTGNVTSMDFMFNNTPFFNQPLNNWNTSNVQNMFHMFANSPVFNYPLHNWNTSSVTNMGFMFNYASSFNQPIGMWNVQNVSQMDYMFKKATSFNQPLAAWNVISLTNIFQMFYGASAFNQNIGPWPITSISNANNALDSCGMDCTNYSATLFGWSNALQIGNTPIVTLGAANKQFGYSAIAARNKLITTYGWSIIGDAASTGICAFPVTSACDTFTWVANGITYTNSGSYSYNVGTNTQILNLQLGNVTTTYSYSIVCASQLPFTYAGHTFTSFGSYTYTNTNVSGCDSIDEFTLYAGTADSITNSLQLCSNQLPYTWNGQSISAAGLYYYNTIGVGGCDSIAILNLTIYPTSIAQILGGNATICFGTNYYLKPNMLLAMGFTSANWLLNNNVISQAIDSVLATVSGNYKLVLTNALGCTSTNEVTITILPVITATLTQVGNLLTCSGIANAITYQWYQNGNAVGTNASNYTITQGGTYSIVVTDNNNCTATAVIEATPVSISEQIKVNAIATIYPNPTNADVSIAFVSTPNSATEFVLYDMLGKKLLTYIIPVAQKNTSLSLKQFNKGCYQFSMLQNGVKIYQGKILVH